jgi:hypothetical protein
MQILEGAVKRPSSATLMQERYAFTGCHADNASEPDKIHSSIHKRVSYQRRYVAFTPASKACTSLPDIDSLSLQILEEEVEASLKETAVISMATESGSPQDVAKLTLLRPRHVALRAPGATVRLPV